MGTNPVGSPPTGRPEAGGVPARVNEMENPETTRADPHAMPENGEPSRHGWRGRINRTLDTIRAHPTGRIALKVAVGTLGALVVALGIALIPLPGPGWAIVILGLAIWAIEFVWAKHLLHYTRRQVSSWTHWVGRQSLGLRFVIGAVGLVFVSAVVWSSVRISTGLDLFVICLDFLAKR
jgi:uncharacterized protein (TIGR02611 family)